jgi:hypothetical protein
LYRCDNHSLQWFTSYLTDRTQRVIVKNSQSVSSKITSGVPQGSILGPLLFLLFVNDLPQFMTESEDLLYADDVNLTSADKDVRVIEKSLNKDCQSAFEWGECNDMVINSKKCNSMLLSTRQKMVRGKTDNITIQVNDEPIPSVKKTKLLGVQLDNNLTWSDQITHIHNQIVRNLYLLKRIKPYLSINDRKQFYNSYILPHFDYCSVIWGNCSKYLLFDIVKLQKKAARLILDKDYTTPSKELFSELQWMPIEERISYHRSLQVFKCVNGVCPDQLQNLFTSTNVIHAHNTRSATNNNLHIGPKHLRSFTHIGSKTWNNLPISVRNSKTVHAFKQAYITNYKNE